VTITPPPPPVTVTVSPSSASVPVSTTKQFTATVILQLVEQGKIKLDGKLSDYLPDYRKDVGQKVTIHHLLTHTSGIPSYTSQPGFFENVSRNPYKVDEFVKKYASGDLEFEPGSKFLYNNSGYVLLGAIIERVTGQSLPAAVRGLIGFRRLGLRQTYWEILEPTPPAAEPRAHQYYDDFDNITLDASHDLYGGGGLVSTVSDLTRFYRALFHGAIFHTRKTLEAMLHVSRAGRRAGAGMGIFRVDVDGERCFGHPGYWGTETIHCPRLDLTIARTTNQADDSDFDSGPLERVAADLARRAAPDARSGAAR